MLHAHHVAGFCARRNVGAFISTDVNALQSLPGRTSLPCQPYSPSSLRRNLHLSLLHPIHVSGDNKTIIITLTDGTIISQKFSPSRTSNITALRRRLTKLLETPDFIVHDENKQRNPNIAFTTTEWQLDPEGDAIHRHISHVSRTVLDLVEKSIMRAADELHHHPHITREESKDGGNQYVTITDQCMTITCTTHSPRGLSIRDLKLAAAINSILSTFNISVRLNMFGPHDLEESRQKIEEQRARMVKQNREKINEALEQCSCGP